jgi:hypothetical protein
MRVSKKMKRKENPLIELQEPKRVIQQQQQKEPKRVLAEISIR